MPRYPLPTHYLHRFVVKNHPLEHIQEWLAANSGEPHDYHVMPVTKAPLTTGIVWIASDDLAMLYKLTWL